MAFINQGRHIGTVGLKKPLELVGGLSCVDYTESGTEYRSCTFTSSGLLTVTGDGLVDVLIISGGGGDGGTGDNSEGGWWQGGGGAGGMVVDTDVNITAGTYAVEVGAGGAGGNPTGSFTARTGNLSWITPQQTLTISGQSGGTFSVGETLTGSGGAIADVIAQNGTSVTISHDIHLQGQIPGPGGTNPEQIPYHGAPGSGDNPIERTLTDLPDFQVSETITGSGGATATVAGITTQGTSMSETEICVGGGGGGTGGSAGYGGGSGGGGASHNYAVYPQGGIGTTNQGNNGGQGNDREGCCGGASGGGGGASGVGAGGSGYPGSGGAGGAGLANYFRDGNTSGTTAGTHIFAGGGAGCGGRGSASGPAAGGSGGGGNSGSHGTVNTGGGGGNSFGASNGGSGVVVVRYDKNQ